MTRFRLLPVLALASGLLLCTVGATAQPTQPVPGGGQPNGPPSGQPPEPKGPPDPSWLAEVPFVPKNAAAFVTLKVSDVIDHPEFKAVLEELKKTPEAMGGFTEAVGLSSHDIDRVTLFWPTVSPRGPGDPVLVITTRRPYNAARVLKALSAEPVFDGDPNDFAQPGIGMKEIDRLAPGPDLEPKRPPYPDPKPKNPPSPDPKPKSPSGFDLELTPPPVFDLKPKSPQEAKLELKIPLVADPKSKLPSCPAHEPKPAPVQPKREPAPVPNAPPAPRGEPLFYRLGEWPFQALLTLDDRTLVFLPGGPGGDATVISLCAKLMQKKPTGPLADALAARGGHTFAAGLSLAPMFREVDRARPPEGAPYAALTAAKIAALTGDLGKTARLTLTLDFDDAAAAKRAAPELEKGLKALAEMATEWAALSKDPKRPKKWEEALYEAVAAGLKKASGKVEGARIVAATEVDGVPIAARAFGAALRALSVDRKFVARANNLKQIGIALHNYHATNGKLPANVYGPKGELLLSWRVHLLPYIEQGNLYNQFKMDEAWDGPNNKKLIELMPKVFEVAGRDAPKGRTYYQAFLTPKSDKPAPKPGMPGDPKNVGGPPVGPPGAQPLGGGRTWLIEGDKDGTTFAAITDGVSQTIGVVEARTTAIWSKPDDLMFGAKLPPLGEEKADTFMALMLDASVREIPMKIKPDVLRLLIDAQDGMPIPDGAFEDDHHRGFDRYWNGPLGFAPASEKKRALRLDELRLLEEQLAEATEILNQEQREAKLLATTAAETAKKFQTGDAKKEDLDKAVAASDRAQARIRDREKEVKQLQDRLNAAERALQKEGVVPKRTEPLKW
jgi:hypothetical protein